MTDYILKHPWALLLLLLVYFVAKICDAWKFGNALAWLVSAPLTWLRGRRMKAEDAELARLQDETRQP